MSFNERVRQVADTVAPHLKVGDHGVSQLDESAFEKTLEGTDLTLDDFKKTQDHRDLFLAGTALALGEAGNKQFGKNKKLENLSLATKLHRDQIDVVYHRQKDLPDGQGGMKPRHGVLSMGYKANGQQGSKGQLKKVKTHLQEEALKAVNG